MKKFTLERAQYLVKRELGIDAASLTAHDTINANTDYPWYGMSSGNQWIELSMEDVPGHKLIALSVSFEDCSNNVMRLFHADNLEFAYDATEALWWERVEDLIDDLIDDPEDDVDIQLYLKRIRQDAQKAHRAHIAHIGALNAQAEKVFAEKWDAITSEHFEKATVLRDAERVIRRELDGENTPAPTTATPVTVQTSAPIRLRIAKTQKKDVIRRPVV